MALADTAKLIVQLDLKGNLGPKLGGINTQIETLARNASARGGLAQIGQGIGTGMRRGALIGGVALAGLATQIKAGVDSLRELESVTAQTDAVIASTGGVAGITAEDIRTLSEEYETLGGVIDDKVIQSGANLLLTFTDVRKDAFEPALEAALDMSTALDQDLQTSILQVGKALQDPVRGVTALRRAGVNLSEDQIEQIKALVDAGKDLEAQQIILTELNEEFGGSFEAAGQTGDATIARFHDSIEGLQQNLATAFIPAIDKVARRLTDVFADPKVQEGVADFGERLAGFLTDENLDAAEDKVRGVFGFLSTVPWGTIGDGLRIAGAGAKTAVDAFNRLPAEAQGALITLLAANKLTGGLVAQGLGQLLTVAASKLGTILAGNVTVVGKNVVGGPGAVGGAGRGGGGGIGGAARTVGALAAIPLVAEATALSVDFVGDAQVMTQGINDKLDALPRDLGSIDESLAKLDRAEAAANENIVGGILGLNSALTQRIDQERKEIITTRGVTARLLAEGKDAISRSVERANQSIRTETFAQRLQHAAAQGWHNAEDAKLANLANFGARTATAAEVTARKNPVHPVTVNSHVTVSVNTSVIQQRLYQQNLTEVGSDNSGGI